VCAVGWVNHGHLCCWDVLEWSDLYCVWQFVGLAGEYSVYDWVLLEWSDLRDFELRWCYHPMRPGLHLELRLPILRLPNLPDHLPVRLLLERPRLRSLRVNLLQHHLHGRPRLQRCHRHLRLSVRCLDFLCGWLHLERCSVCGYWNCPAELCEWLCLECCFE
jgi:hypothetical protein